VQGDDGAILSAYDDSRDIRDDYKQGFLSLRVEQDGQSLPEAELYGDWTDQGYIGAEAINTLGYLDVAFENTLKSSLNGDKIVFAGAGAGSAVLRGKPSLIDKDHNVYRYSFTGAFEGGDVQVTFAADTFTSSSGLKNVEQTETNCVLPDIAPLAFDSDASAFEWNDDANRFEYAGSSVGLGDAAGEGQSFTPLLTVDGVVGFDKDHLFVDGIVWASLAGANAALFDGEFEMPIGQTASSYFTDVDGVLTSQFTLAGCDLRFSSLALALPNGSSNGEIQLQASLKLPDALGSGQLAVADPYRLVLTPATGSVGVTGGTLTVPDIEIEMAQLEMQAQYLSVEYVHYGQGGQRQ